VARGAWGWVVGRHWPPRCVKRAFSADWGWRHMVGVSTCVVEASGGGDARIRWLD
jgi:hypothetical protein